MSLELLQKNANRSHNIIEYPDGRQPYTRTHAYCVGCSSVIEYGVTVNHWKIAANHVYCHKTCMEQLKEKNYNRWKYSQSNPRSKKDKTTHASHTVDSELDERDKHLFDKPTKW